MNEELLNFYKEMCKITNKTYYYSLEKYRSICENISKELYIEQFNKIKSYYSNNPVAFAEDYLGIRLKWYQRFLLKDKLSILRNKVYKIKDEYVSGLFK
jgi:hypothetical protein